MFAAKNELFTRPSGYTISRSVRLRSSATAYFSRTFGAATSTTQGTFSFWLKRGNLSASYSYLWSASNYDLAYFDGSGTLWVAYLSNLGYVSTNAVFRDPAAWYHVVITFDTPNATAANRLRVYVNGVQQTLNWGTTPQTQNATWQRWNVSGYTGDIGDFQFNHANPFDGYYAEWYFIDGQALTPTSFGQFNSVTGVWQPLKYTGTYGNNGFYLNFSDNSAATAAAIGKDSSGNGNNWTPNNISVTSGVTYDSMLDVPTLWADGGNGRGNYCVLNPLLGYSNKITPQDGNLYAFLAAGSNAYFGSRSTFGLSSGKWYWEVTAGAKDAGAGQWLGVGVVADNVNWPAGNGLGANNGGYEYLNDGVKWGNGSASAYGASWTTNDIIGVALDVDSQTITFYKNGASQGTAFTSIGSGAWFPTVEIYRSTGTNQGMYANFGQRPFTYTPPSGFKALNTQNLPSPTISNGALYMAATTYTGNGTSQSINNSVNGVSFQPDFVWYKDRSVARDHALFNVTSGATYLMSSNNTSAESAVAGTLTSFNSNGYSIGSAANANANGETYVGWQWKAGGTGSSNTSGSITSTVSVNATAGFSVVAYNSGASGDKTVGHGLGVAPSMIITKSRSSASYNWSIYHASVATTVKKYLTFTTDALQDNGTNIWGSAFPTSSVFGITSGNGVVASTDCIAYCFSAVANYSAFGSYSSNGSSDGSFVYLGFRPRFLMIKKATGAVNANAGWYMFDSSRGTINVVGPSLRADLSAAETTYNGIDFLSNGFKLRIVDIGTNSATAGDTYIYAAFAENPFKLALAR